MVSGTDNESIPNVAADESEGISQKMPLKQRILGRLRRLKTRDKVIFVIASIGILLLMTWVIMALLSTDDVVVVDPAASSPLQPERIPFQTALANLVQAGDDTLELYGFSPTSEQMETLACVERLKILRIEHGSLTPQAGEVLASMPQLEQLHFRGVSMDDTTLDTIAKSQTIWLLNIADTNVSPNAISRLADMPKLRQLRLAIKNGGNRYTQSFSNITKLRAIHLIGFGINNESLKLLANLPNLESLYIDDSNINDEGWQWLFENKPHLHVHIDQKHHDRDPHKH